MNSPVQNASCPRFCFRPRFPLDFVLEHMYSSYMNSSLPFSLIGAAHRIEARLEEALQQVNLSGPKYAALAILVGANKSITLSELADKLTCVRSNVTQLVDRLETDGLAKRVDDPSNRRIMRVEITKHGRDLHTAGEKLVSAILKDVMKELSGVDQKVLQKVLEGVN